MIPTVGDVMREVRNYFVRTIHADTWTIRSDCLLNADPLPCGAWIAITGSDHHDGVYQLAEDRRLHVDGPDETFTGTVYQLAPSVEFLALCGQIAAWCAVQPKDGLKRESFGGYSREAAYSADGKPLTWQQCFRCDLQRYRRMYPEVRLC